MIKYLEVVLWIVFVATIIYSITPIGNKICSILIDFLERFDRRNK